MLINVTISYCFIYINPQDILLPDLLILFFIVVFSENILRKISNQVFCLLANLIRN